MRTLLVLPYLDRNGTERHALLLSRYLLAKGHEVAVAGPPGPMASEFEAAGAAVHPLPPISLGSFSRAMRRAAELAKGMDVVHVHAAQEFCGGLRWAGFTGPIVFTAHCYHAAVDYAKAGWFLNPFCQRIIAVSEAERQRFERAKVRNLTLILNGIDLAEFAGLDRQEARNALEIPPTRTVAIAVGRLARPKSFDVFLKALALAPGDLTGLVVGEGPEDKALRALARRLELGDRVRWLGRREDVPQLLAAADIYVSASRREGLSLAALEALATSLPLVVSTIPEFAEIARDGDNARVFAPGDAMALALALGTLAQQPELRRTMGARSHLLSASFSLERMGSQTLAVYEEAVSASRSRI